MLKGGGGALRNYKQQAYTSTNAVG